MKTEDPLSTAEEAAALGLHNNEQLGALCRTPLHSMRAQLAMLEGSELLRALLLVMLDETLPMSDETLGAKVRAFYDPSVLMGRRQQTKHFSQ